MIEGCFQLPDREHMEFKSRVLMKDFKWLVPPSERPQMQLVIPPDSGKSAMVPRGWAKGENQYTRRRKAC